MPKLTPISGKKLVKLLGLCGFELVRIRGSHHFLKNEINGNTTLVPVHGKEDLIKLDSPKGCFLFYGFIRKNQRYL